MFFLVDIYMLINMLAYLLLQLFQKITYFILHINFFFF